MNADIPFTLMPLPLLGSVALLALVSSITPGPNNIMLTASGLNFGFRRSLPHMLGVTVGWMILLVLCGLGLGALFRYWPGLQDWLKVAGGLYLLYLAWRIARAGPMQQGEDAGRPFTFVQAAAFQWVNPKAWVMTLSLLSYAPEQDFVANLLLMTLIGGTVNFPSVAVWTAFGSALRHVLRNPAAVRAFNLTMALLLVASLAPLALELLS